MLFNENIFENINRNLTIEKNLTIETLPSFIDI